MKKYMLTALVMTMLIGAGNAFASGNELAYKRVRELVELSTGAVASGDVVPILDSSTGKVKKIDATNLPFDGTFDGAIGGTTPAAGAFTTLSASGSTQFDGGVTTAGTLTTTGAINVDSVTINNELLSLPGRLTITICGDGTTINNNTVFYGPSRVPVAGAMRTCDITQVGNVTEATADAPALEATAFQVLSMDCLTADPGAAGVSFTLRTAAGATVPSVTCTAANTELGCTANIATTAEIASGATIAIAAASSGDQGATSFACTIHAAY